LQHKRGRKSNYANSLKNDQYWKEVRQMVIARDRHCQFQNCKSQLYLEVHHKTYYVNGKSIRGNEKEHLDCLVLLCYEHHELAHAQSKH